MDTQITQSADMVITRTGLSPLPGVHYWWTCACDDAEGPFGELAEAEEAAARHQHRVHRQRGPAVYRLDDERNG